MVNVLYKLKLKIRISSKAFPKLLGVRDCNKNRIRPIHLQLILTDFETFNLTNTDSIK